MNIAVCNSRYAMRVGWRNIEVEGKTNCSTYPNGTSKEGRASDVSTKKLKV